MKLPIGISDFRKIREGGYYYVDKSHFIEEFINDNAHAILITRPFHFGKTLNFSMLRYFLDIKNAEKNRDLFKGLKIEQLDKEFFDKHQGKYPIIFLSFENIKCKTFEEAYAELQTLISEVYIEHEYILSTLSQHQKDIYKKIISKKAEKVSLVSAIECLMEYLHHYYNVKPIVLLDGYDTPLQTSYIYKYVEELIDVIYPLMSTIFKDNVHLQKGIISGVLSIPQADIFSGLNNLSVQSIFSTHYANCFGFLETEIDALLKTFQASEYKQIINEWYNGYQIDQWIMYNPWSIIQFLDNRGHPDLYWPNSLDSSLIIDLLHHADVSIKFELEKLLQFSQTIEKIVPQNITFKDLEETTDGLWSFLVFSGYLKPITVKYTIMGKKCELAIPNKEVREFYLQIIKNWFSKENQETASVILKALTTANMDEFKKQFSKYVMQPFSFWNRADTKGKHPDEIYHAFSLGMLIHLDKQQYYIKSQQKFAEEHYDVMILPKDKKQLAILLEFKSIHKRGNTLQLQQSASNALKQIITHSYATELIEAQIETVLMVGIAFAGKKVEVAYKKGRVNEFLSSDKPTLTLNTSTPNVNPPPSAFPFLVKPQPSKQALSPLVPTTNLAKLKSESSTSSKINLFSQAPQPKGNFPIIIKHSETTCSAVEKRRIYPTVDTTEEQNKKSSVTFIHDITADVETISSSSEEEALDLENVKKKKFA